MIQKIKASIIGASGYVGLELIRLLSLHPNVEILYIFSRDEKDDISFKYPHLANIEIGENCSNIDIIAKDSDVVFLSLPHGEAEIYATELLGKVRVIDLSSDFRIKDKQLFKKYYENSHNQTITDKFVYGFIGKNFNDIKTTECIANPGCFAICMQMTMLPFIDNIKKN
jgi:N-acetyl-gamma-glutamylphosphate reductase